MTDQTTKPVTKRSRRKARQPNSGHTTQAPSATAVPRLATLSDERVPGGASATKTAVVLGLLARAEGATLEQLIQVTGWLPHTTRAALTGLKKKGYEITSVKTDGVRTYCVVDKHEPGTAPDERLASEAQP